MVVLLWAWCPCGEYLQSGAVSDTDQQSLMKIRPGYGLTVLSLSGCSGPCLSLALGTAYDGSQFHHGFWGFGSALYFSPLLALSVFSHSWIVNQHLLPSMMMTIFSWLCHHIYVDILRFLTIHFSLFKELQTETQSFSTCSQPQCCFNI